uniref:Si:ch73-379j16.2 n=1 Tax=Xiphophorus couchianus TaxID=32473 RepID=A0A3B5KUN4_9TELE
MPIFQHILTPDSSYIDGTISDHASHIDDLGRVLQRHILEITLENPLRIFNIEIEVLDMNDNAPQFRRDAIHLDISEATTKGERFSLSNAVDPDVGTNSVKTYYLSESEYFNIEIQTGRDGSKFADLILIKTLDREKKEHHNLILTAVDGGTPARSGTVNIFVHVLDTNDNAPTFDKAAYNVKVMENSPIGSLVIDLNASDLDDGSNSDITYSYSLYTSEKTQETFNLNPTTVKKKQSVHFSSFFFSGSPNVLNNNQYFRLDTDAFGEEGKVPFLVLQRSLDREQTPQHWLLLTATDGGKPAKSGTMNITVILSDINDNAPVCDKQKYTATIKENAPVGTFLLTISASDSDEGENGEVEYSLRSKHRGPSPEQFELNSKTGKLAVRGQLDYEEKQMYELKVLASDKGSVSLSTQCNVVIRVEDVNDNQPEIDITSLSSPENTPPGTHFQIHAARDPDFGIQSVRLYRLGQNDYFDIQVKESEEDKIPFLVLKKPLDREGKSEHNLVLTALDGGTPSRSGKLNLTINVLDANDNRPVFSKDIYTVSLNENAPIGTIVIKVNATDSDEGLNGEIEYTFGKTQKKQVYDIFELDSITGEIRLKGKVDFEETEIYRLDLQASDKGQPPWTGESRVVIKLKDLNDNKPEIEITSLSSQIPEDSKPGTVVALISVRDRDSGMNGKVICKISDNVPFDLTPSIEENMFSLVTKGRLDREAESHYDITITATDSGEPRLSAAKTLQIHVSDINDNRPVFSQNPFEIYLVENNTPGVSVFSITASDKDVNENAAITYSIRKSDGINGDVAHFFNIHSENGEISSMPARRTKPGNMVLVGGSRLFCNPRLHAANFSTGKILNSRASECGICCWEYCKGSWCGHLYVGGETVSYCARSR